ncbi:XRE family transcriptional regulator [bacterium]|jgi:transcriptional regulator with XRE-family HTH domain|nr:XRE family transcriptional regulator [bacterium]
MSKEKLPFMGLGSHLKYLREQSHQSLSEVSGAVEIDENSLSNIEAGKARPDEEILLLLISHFNIQDREAVQLWELADYDSEIPEKIRPDTDANNQKPVVMLLAPDGRTIYSDGVEIITNNAGVTINFTQLQSPNKTSSVAKVGMSYDQAHEVLKTLEKALLKAKYLNSQKNLPAET